MLATIAVLLVGLAAVPAHAHDVERVVIPQCAVADAVDSDDDGISDACEFAMASAFAPLLMVRSGGCNWDTNTQHLGGGYLHAVQRVGDAVRIAYLPAYFVDCGWKDLRCILPLVNCAPHAGDSEFIVVEVRETASVWAATAVFLSAHCFGRHSPSCRWYRGDELQRFGWHGAAPVVWVAEGRNANYPGWRECNAGHRTMDTCARHDAAYRFPVQQDRNIGSRVVPNWNDGCLAGRALDSAAVDPRRTECFWAEDARFRGWQVDGHGVTAYERYLRDIAGF